MSYHQIPSYNPQEENDKFSENKCSCTRTHIRHGSRARVFTLHAGLVLAYIALLTALFAVLTRSRWHRLGSTGYSPAQEAITYETKTLNTHFVNNPFSGDPRPEHDKAWSDILKNTHIRFSEGELHRLNQTSLALKDGGYVGKLGVYHELHCVKWIRKWIHRDHYWPALKGAMLEERKNHIDHCLEMMRLNAMCRGSLSVTTFRWLGSLPNPVPHEEQECIDWEKLDSWSNERRVDLSNLDVLKDRPEPQDWELTDPDVRLGVVEGDVDRFAEVLKNGQNS